ncbi:MAG: hypothetical protein ACTS6A_01100 [Candidatus Hodgkinia cicadicola]
MISVFNGVRRLEIAIMAFGFAFHAFSSTSEVATFGGGLSLFAVKTSLSRRPSLAISCGCPLTRRDMLICGSTVTFCHKIGPGSNVLLHSANEVWGATADNSFGIGLTDSLLNDGSRRLLLARFNLASSIIHYRSAIRASLARATAEWPYFGSKLLSRLSGETAPMRRPLLNERTAARSACATSSTLRTIGNR